MKQFDAKYEALRAISKMIQDDPGTPSEIRVDFAIIDKMQDTRDLLGKVTEKTLMGRAQPEKKKEWLEYLTLVESGIRIFAQEQGLLEEGEQDES